MSNHNEMPALYKLFGTKATLASQYPKPNRDTVVEMFCGAAGYSLHYKVPHAILIEKDPVIFGMMDFLINDPDAEKHVLSLPDSVVSPKVIHPRDLQAPEPLKNLVSFWVQRGSAHRVHQISPSNIEFMREGHKATMWGPHIKDRIIRTLPLIKNWEIHNASWEDADSFVKDPDDVMWFCDPPYFNPFEKATFGDHYICKAKDIDFDALGRWCKSKERIIVCETMHAKWLNFMPLKQTYNQLGNNYVEAVWMRGMDHSMLMEDDMDVD